MEVGFKAMSELTVSFRRDLKFRLRGEIEEGQLFIGDVRKQEDGQWVCYWSLSFVHPELGKHYGNDALDSMYKCIRFVGGLIRGSEEDGLQVWWRFEGDHAGFDVPL